jgi:hypothetical protein
MSRILLQQALDALTHHRQSTTFQFQETNAAIKALEAELAKPEPIYVMGNYAGEGKVVRASFGLPKGAFEFAPYTGAGESAKIKHSLEPKPEQNLSIEAMNEAWYLESQKNPHTAFNSWCRGYEAAIKLAKPEQAKYSDIVSDGGLDPRNKFDAQPEQDHGFDRTASHMVGEYVDTAQSDNQEPVAPPRKPWQGLTDEEIKEVLDLNVAPWSLSGVALQHVMDDARALEAKLKEKNT